MKAILAILVSLALMGASSECGKRTTVEEVKTNAEVIFVLHVYDETMIEVRSDTEGVGFAATITLDAVTSNPGTPENPNPVKVMDPQDGTIHDAPYAYEGTIPHRNYQLFGPEIIAVTFKAEFVLWPGWRMECLTTTPEGRTIHRNFANNITGFPFESYVICLWP